jgi:hypothetical protein
MGSYFHPRIYLQPATKTTPIYIPSPLTQTLIPNSKSPPSRRRPRPPPRRPPLVSLSLTLSQSLATSPPPTLPHNLTPPACRCLRRREGAAPALPLPPRHSEPMGGSALQLQTSRQLPSAVHLRTTAARPVAPSLLVGHEEAIGNLNPQFLIWLMHCEMAGCPQFLIWWMRCVMPCEMAGWWSGGCVCTL